MLAYHFFVLNLLKNIKSSWIEFRGVNMFEDNKPKLFACETKNSNLEWDVVEIMKTIQYEMNKRGYKAVIVGLVKDKVVDEIDLSNIFK